MFQYRLTALLMMEGLNKMKASISKLKDLASKVRMEPTMKQTRQAPTFHFQQIQWLYQNSFAIEKSKIQTLLRLDRKLLIKDLSTVLNDAIRRYEYFSEKDYQPETHNFLIYALLLLKEIKAEEAFACYFEIVAPTGRLAGLLV